jgi:hypothetical protein
VDVFVMVEVSAPGTPLATRENWTEIIAAAKQYGAHALWVAFHGYGAEHDRQRTSAGMDGVVGIGPGQTAQSIRAHLVPRSAAFALF